MLSKTFALLGLVAAASAHIKMTNPAPYGDPDNGPLKPDGSDYPCKGLQPSGSGGENQYEAGSTQQLKFMGSAVHGGGSCQVSVTTDLNPDKNSKWKVIKSIEGGCPARDQTGNMGDNAGAEVPYEYDFKFPEEMADGQYVLAWTWFNKVGNREMYMNCASVDITGGKGDESFLDSLPDMFVANIGNDCTTLSDTDVEFPHPGNEVERLNGATDAFKKPTEAACTAGSPGSPSNPKPSNGPSKPGPEPQPAPVPTNAPTGAPAPGKPTTTTSQSIPGGVFMPQPTERPGSPDAPEQPKPEEPQPEPQPEPTPGNGSGGGNGSSEGAQPAGSACAPEGMWNCVGGSSFQRCGSGIWSPVMALAAGMSCDGGQSAEFKVYATRGKRTMRRRKLPVYA